MRSRAPVWAQLLARKLLTALGEVVLSHPNMANLYSYPQEAVQPVADHIEDIDTALRRHMHYRRNGWWADKNLPAIADPESCENDSEPAGVVDLFKAWTPPKRWNALQDELEQVAGWMRDNLGKYAGCAAIDKSRPATTNMDKAL